MKWISALIVLVLVLSVVPALGQGYEGGATGTGGAAFKIFLPKQEEFKVETYPAASLGVLYDIPTAAEGVHNIRVLFDANAGAGYSSTAFGFGYANAPTTMNAIFGAAFVFDMTFPSAALTESILGFADTETWFGIGADARIDFDAGALPASLVARYTRTFRDRPDQFTIGLLIGVKAAPTKSR